MSGVTYGKERQDALRERVRNEILAHSYKKSVQNFDADISSFAESVSKINGWQDAAAMEAYQKKTASMLERANTIKKYQTSQNAKYDTSQIDKVIEGLTETSEWLAERSEVFGGYESADDYNAAVKRTTDDEAKYGGLSSAELKQVMEGYIAERDSKNEDIDAQIAEERGKYAKLYNLANMMTIDLSEEDIAYLAQYGIDPTEIGYTEKAATALDTLFWDTEAKIAELEKGRLAEADATAQHYYYQALLEELGAQGYSSEKKGTVAVADRYTNFDYAVRAGEDAVNKLIEAQKLATGAYTDFESTGYGELTDEEKSLYLYLYDNVSPEAAVDYYNYLYNTNSFYNMALTARVGLSRSKAKSDFERVMGAFGAGLNSWIAGNKRAIKSLYSDETVPTYPFEYEMQFDRDTLDDSVVKKGLYDLGVSFGNMAPSVLAGVLTSGMGTGVKLATNVATFGVSIYGNAYDEALKQGYSKSQAINYGILNAASEVALQNLIGGIPGVGQHLTGEFVTQLANKTSNVLLKVAAQIGGDALGEFTEEYLQEVLGQVFRNVALGENGEVKLFSEEALYSGIIGALMSMGMSVPVEAVNAVNLNSVGKLYNTEISETADGIGKTGAQALIEEGLAANPTSEAYQYAKRLSKRQKDGKTISNIQMGTLARLIERTDAVEPSGGNVQFQIRYTIDNAPVVEVTEDILEGVPRSEWVKTVKNKIAEFAPSIPLHGRLVKVNQKTKNEYTNSKYTQKKKRGADSVYEDKLKAAGKLDEIVLASTNYINEDLKHERADNIKEFARGDVNLRIGEDDYSAKVIVGFTKQNEMVLYDVIDFIPRTFRLKEKNRASDITVQDTSKGLAGSDRQENSVDSGNGQVLRVQAQSSPQLTSETLHDYPAANNSIPYSEEFVKNNLENHFSKYKESIDELWSAALVMDSEADASETASSGERTAENSNAVTGKIEAPEAITESDTEDDERLDGYRADVETVTQAAKGLSGNSEMVAQYEKVNADVDDRKRQNADVYVSDYTMVRDLAAGGSSEATIRRIIESGNGAGASLNEAQFLAAFYEGRALHDRQKGKKPVVDRSRPRRVGKVYYNGAQAVRVGDHVLSLPASGISNGKKLNADQQAVVDFAEKVLAPLGVDVVFYSSKKDRSLPNGLYDGKYIYIDIEAGMSERASETFVAYALAHELTHMAERLSPELWQKYADAVLRVLADEEGVSIRQLIARKKNEHEQARIKSLRKTYPEKKDAELREMVEPLSEDGAIREIVADASQLIFTRESRFAEKLAAKDATLGGKIKQLVMDAIKKLQEVLHGVPHDGISEHLVNHLEELREYFDDMMADSLYRAGHGTAEENDFFESALEKGQKKEKSQTTGKVQNQNRRIPEDVSDAERPGKSKKERIGMADFVNRDSAVWRNVAYENDAEKLKIMQDVHSAMVEEGAVVTVPYEVLKTVSQSFPDLRGVKKKERTPLLKEAIGKLKNDIKNFLDGLKNKSFEFEVSGKILEAKLYNTGINEVLEKITQSKAGMLYATEQIFRNARYLYSTSDYDGDSNVYRWNYFYTPVKIGEETVGVRIAVRDLAKQGESQIYNWGIKRDASLGGVGDDLNNRKSNGTSSDASTNMIHQDEPIVKENTENIFANRNSDDGQFQYRRIDADTDRQMLVRALEGAAKSEADRGIVKDYAERLGKYREMQRQLNDIRKDIDETLEDVNAGLVHKSELNPLYNRANILEEKLRSEDAKLLRMEALAPLHNLVEAERAKALAAEQEATRERAKSEKRLEAQKQAMENRQAANKRKAQERQLRIQYLARAERAISRLYRWATHPTKKDHVPTELLPYVKSLFEAVDVSHHFAQIEKLEEQLAAQNSRIWELQEAGAAASVIEAQEAFRDDLINRIKKLEGTQHNVTWADRLGQLGKIMSSVEKAQETSSIYVSFAPGLAEAIEKQVDTFTDDVHVRLFDASPEKIRFYAEAIESIAHSITEAGRLYANKRAAKVETLAELTIDEFRHERQEAAKPHKNAWARGFYGIDALSPAYFAHKLGHGAEAVMGGLFDGFYNTIGNVRVINEFSDRLREKYKVSSFTGKNNVIHHIKLEQGGAISLTTTQLMTVYALSDRPQAQKHMFGRGIQSFQGNIDEAVRKTQPFLDSMKDEAKRWVGKGDSDLSQYAKMLFGSIDIHKLTQKDVDGMINLLTGNQKACVKEIKTFLHDVVAPMGNKTSQTLYLYDMFTEDNYFPIETVKTYLRPKDKDMKDGDIDTRSIFSILNQGFTKNLSDQAGNPIVIRDIFDVFMEHCFGMANYGGLGVAVSDTIKWLSYRQAGEGSTLRDEMKKAWGTSAERYIRNLLMSIEGELKGTDGARAINKLVRNAKIASVAGNARVVLQQPTAYFRAGAVLSPKSMLNASIHPFDLKKMIEEATEHSELMYYKSLGFYDMNNSQSLLEKMKGDKSMADRIREWTTVPAGAMDMMTWGTLWRACRLEIDSEIREKGLSVTKNSDEYFRMVRDKFHEVINLTQVIDSPMHKNKLMSDPDSLMKQLTAFMAEPMLTLNMVQSAVDDVRRKRPGGKVKLVRASVVFLLGTAATGVMSAFADAARDDDDDEGWMEKYLEAALRNITGVDLDDISVSGILAGDWNLLNNMPIIKEFFSILEGYDPSRMELSGMEKMVQAMNKVYKFFSGEGTGDFESVMYSIAQVISAVSGIPVSNLWRLVRSMVNTVKAWAQ